MAKPRLVRYQDIKTKLVGEPGTQERIQFDQELATELAALQQLQHLRTIEGTLANDEYSTDEEMEVFLRIECPGFDPALIGRIIR